MPMRGSTLLPVGARGCAGNFTFTRARTAASYPPYQPAGIYWSSHTPEGHRSGSIAPKYSAATIRQRDRPDNVARDVAPLQHASYQRHRVLQWLCDKAEIYRRHHIPLSRSNEHRTIG